LIGVLLLTHEKAVTMTLVA